MKKTDKGIYFITSAIGVAALLLIIFAISYQILQRMMGSATAWSEELACIGLILMTLFALYAVERDDEQLRMELIFSLFPKSKPILKTIGNILNIGLAIIVIYSERIFLPSVSKRLTPAMKIPLRYVHYLIVVCMIIWLAALCMQTAADIICMAGGKEGGGKRE